HLTVRQHQPDPQKYPATDTILAAKKKRAVVEPFDKPFEANRNFAESAPERSHDPIDEATAHERLAYSGLMRPMGTMSQKIIDGHSKVMIRIHQAQRRGDNAVPICVGIVREGDLELILQTHQTRHRIRAGTIHSDFPVMIESHETEGGIYLGINDGDIETVDGLDRIPVMDCRATEWIRTHPNTGGTDAIHVDYVGQIPDVRHKEIVGMR